MGLDIGKTGDRLRDAFPISMTLNQYQLQGSFSAEPEVAAKIEGAIRSALAEGGVQNPEIDFGRDWLSVDHITTEARLAGNQVLTEGPSEFDGLE